MTIKKFLVIDLTLDQIIYELCIVVGLIQQQFVTYLGVTYSTVERLENQRSESSPLAMQKIENLLEMNKQVQKLLISTGLTQNHDKTNRKGRKGHKGIRVSESSCVSPEVKAESIFSEHE